MVAMSGGVDSSVAAAVLVARGHDVVGATLKLWGGPSDSGCCSVADVEDARRVADQLGIVHHVFNLTDDFEASVVGPYVAAHAAGLTPNPCIECNRHIKFDRLLARATRLGFDAVATGHHARVDTRPSGRHALLRGVDEPKDQSYVLSMLGQDQLARLEMPIGHMMKSEVRTQAAGLGLRTADKPDSQDVCFIRGTEGRAGFLSRRLPLHPAPILDERTGETVGAVDAVELVTVGQRRGMGHGTDGTRRYVVEVDVPGRRVVVGGDAAVRTTRVPLVPGSLTWTDQPLTDGAAVITQLSAHGRPVPCMLGLAGGTSGLVGGQPVVELQEAQRLVAPGQTVAFYDLADPDRVLGAGIAARDAS
jgi:tRNA-specific 2-thiouridylase